MKQRNIDNNQRLLITQQEMVLIKNSNETKNIELYGNLYDCIENYTKLSKIELDNNLVFDKKAKTVLLNIENKKIMMNKIMDEWYSVNNCDIVENLINCQLCGRPNKYVFYIRNRITECDLHIGSDCVKHFPNIIGIRQQKKRLSQLQKEQSQQKRKIEFEICEGEEVGFIEDAERKFKDFPILLNYKLYNEIKDTIKQLNLSKTSYIKSGGNLEDIYSSYCVLKEKFSDLYEQANKHYNNIKDNPLVCDKETSEWLLKNNSLIWEKVSKNNGIFSVDTLMKVYDERYIGKMYKQIMACLKDNDLKILQIGKSYIHFSIQNSRYVYVVTFIVPIRKFMQHIGCYALTDKQYQFGKEDFQDISIEETHNNFQAVYNSVLSTLNKFGYDFVIEEKTSQAYWKKLAQYERRGRWSDRVIHVEPLYKKSDIKLFLKVLSPFLLKSETFLEKNFDMIIRNMESGKTWLTQKEKNSYEEAARYARGMQKQKELIPY